MFEFEIVGQRVVCGQDDQGRRTWHCGCAYYEQRLAKYGEGFCPHVALAIERVYKEGRISLADE